jgi:hypothetical protein
MTTQQLACSEIEELVNNFKNLSASQRKGLNEMQTRLGHILPLFKAGILNKSQCIFLNFQSVCFEDPAEKSAHDEIVRLVEEMLALQKERQSVRREDDLDRVRDLERQIAQVDAEIVQRVYSVYGLTEEEIKIVEGG